MVSVKKKTNIYIFPYSTKCSNDYSVFNDLSRILKKT